MNDPTSAGRKELPPDRRGRPRHTRFRVGERAHPEGESRAALEAMLEAAAIPFVRMGLGSAWALLTPSLGAKLLGFGLDDENAFWTAPALAPAAWCVGGQRTWIAPEMGANSLYFRRGEWSLAPAIDPGSYRPLEAAAPQPGTERDRGPRGGAEPASAGAQAAPQGFGCDLEIDSATGSRFRLSIERVVTLLPEARSAGGERCARISITHSLVNRDAEAAAEGLALWSIIQIPNRRGALLVAGLRPEVRFEPSRYFGELPAERLALRRDSLSVLAGQGRRFKFGVSAQASAGWLCALRPSRESGRILVILKRFAVEPASRYVDKPDGSPEQANGDAAQIYNGPETGGDGFSEIECHSPSRPIEPGGRLSHTVELAVWKVGVSRVPALLRDEVAPDLELPQRLLGAH